MEVQTETETQADTETELAELRSAIEREVKEGEAKLARLKTAAEDADAEEQRWKTTFEREPTEQAFAARAVAEQKAKNAHAMAARFESETLAALLARQGEVESKERQLAVLRLDLPGTRQRVYDLISQFVTKFPEAVRELAERTGQRRALQGAGQNVSTAIAEVNERLRPIGNANAHEGGGVSVGFHYQGNKQMLVFQLNVPMSINGHDF